MLASLPIELLVKVFNDLDVFTLVSCRFVSRSFNNLIKSSSLLQYKLELALAGVEPNPTSTLGLSECLEGVRSYRQSWEDLTWTSDTGWQEAIGNIYQDRGTFTMGEIITRESGDSDYKWRTRRYQPKSKHRRVEERTWSEARPVITFRGVDASQDLMLATPSEDEGEISILSFSTLEPYPGVANPTIRIPVGQDSTLEMDVYESYLIASTHPRYSFGYKEYLYVYNWRTGRLLANILYPCDGFFLLTKELVACYVTGQGPTDHFAIFRVIDTEDAVHYAPPLIGAPLCVFNLPRPTSGGNWYLNRGRMGYRSCSPPKDSTIPFYSPGKRLLLSLWLLSNRGAWRNPECSLVVPMRTLLNLIPSEPTPSTVVFEWDAWGPTGSRFFSGPESRQMSLQFGWKIARPGLPDLSATPPGDSREVGITVYDFNPLPFHGLSDVTEGGKSVPQGFEVEAGERSRSVVTSPSPCPEFAGLGGVQTSLPYRVTSAPFEIRGRSANPIDYEISLGEDGMIVWTHITLDYIMLTI